MKLPFGLKRAPSPETRELVQLRDGGCCVVCRKVLFGRRGLDWSLHHRRSRAVRRPDTHEPQNLLSVCGGGNDSGCHGWIHSHPTEARLAGWIVRRNSDLNLLEMPVKIRGTWVHLTADGKYADEPGGLS